MKIKVQTKKTFITMNTDNKYNEIMALITEQKRLVGEGKMEKPALRVGFTAEEEEMFRNGIEVNEYFKKYLETNKTKMPYEKNRSFRQRTIYA
jgi:hypothetical protein